MVPSDKKLFYAGITSGTSIGVEIGSMAHWITNNPYSFRIN